MVIQYCYRSIHRYSSEQTYEERGHNILILLRSSSDGCHHPQILTHVAQKVLEDHRSSDLQRQIWRNTSTKTKHLWSGDHFAIGAQMLADEAEDIGSSYEERIYLSALVQGRPPVTLPLGQVANVINYRRCLPMRAATKLIVLNSFSLRKLSRNYLQTAWSRIAPSDVDIYEFLCEFRLNRRWVAFSKNFGLVTAR